MNRFTPALTLGCLLLASLLLPPPAARAIDMAVPGNFFSYTVDSPGDPGDAYYYMNPVAISPDWQSRKNFIAVINASGELLWFRHNPNHTNFFPVEHTGGYVYARGSTNYPEAFVIMDDGFEEIEEIPEPHPTDTNLTLDAHELLMMEDGSKWTLWWEPRTYDMSDILPGGQEEVEVLGHVIQHWDADGTVLWEWRSLDHLDQMPFTDRPDSTNLYNAEFEHLHVNSIDVTDDAMYLSCRNVSLVLKVDRTTGDILWRMGTGPGNEFTFLGDADVPLDFNYQHDARITPEGHLTVFDNGVIHDPDHAYAREYVVDETNMTAELIWWQVNDPPSPAFITGLHRKLDDGNHMIGWGNRYPTTTATEVDADGNVVWSITFDEDPDIGQAPGTYRVYKSYQYTPSYRPYVSYWYDDETDEVELTCNWFGHEDEVAAYNIYGGYEEGDLELLTVTDTGFHYESNPLPLQPYFYQIVALDTDGNEISEPSNLLKVQFAEPGLVITPVSSTSFTEADGTLTFAATMTNTSPEPFNNAMFRTQVILPNGNTYGPLMNVSFSMLPFSQISVANLTQTVPPFSPLGDYTFEAYAGLPNNYYSDSFPITVEGDTTQVAGGFSGADQWVATRGEWPAEARVMAVDDARTRSGAEQPNEFTLAPVHPNPFNARATATVTLPHAGHLKVELVNLLGQTVVTLHDGVAAAGRHALTLDGSALASGVYFLHASHDGRAAQARKVLLLR